MQTDFHHGVTYVLSRWAGFTSEEADIIAYAAQYVDDAVNGGFIKFENAPMYYHVRSAHKTFDYKNFDECANHNAWMPCHFLPGGKESADARHEQLEFVSKLICLPNSHIAQDMLKECFRKRNEANSLHRLGITMHVYADTWAHQGFIGINHRLNRVTQLRDFDRSRNIQRKVWSFIKHPIDTVKNLFVETVFPMGHGAALEFPDRPYLKWSYLDGFGKPHERDNSVIFVEAAKEMFLMLKRWKQGLQVNSAVDPLNQNQMRLLKACFEEFDSDDESDRHNKWLEAIANGKFDFSETVEYAHSGTKSWKFEALGTEHFKYLPPYDIFKYNENKFPTSNWKLFHDALAEHCDFIMNNLLPSHGIVNQPRL